jgi:hypothetical protein
VTEPRTRHDAVRELELQIQLNERLPPELRCDEAIALMKDLLARQRQGPSLKLVQDNDA